MVLVVKTVMAFFSTYHANKMLVVIPIFEKSMQKSGERKNLGHKSTRISVLSGLTCNELED